MIISKWSKFIQNGNKIIILNEKTGDWIKINNELREILERINQFDMCKEDIIEFILNTEDQKYIIEFTDILLKRGHLVEEKEEETLDLSFSITNNCNLNCKHCCYSANHSKHSSLESLSTEQIKQIMDISIDEHTNSISITGGEPLFRKDFFEITEHLKRKQTKKILMTNGTLINEKNVKQICSIFQQIDISLDGYNEESCRKIRGKGVFDQVILSIRQIKKESKIPVTLSYVLSKDNKKNLNKFLKLCDHLNVTPLLRMYLPIGKAKNEKVYNEHWDFKWYRDISIQSLKPDTCRKCEIGRSILHIDHDGGLYPCGLFVDKKYKIGNIFDIKNDFRKKLEIRLMKVKTNPNKNFKYIFPEYNEPCIKCRANMFCWNCLADYVSWKEQGKCDMKFQRKIEQAIWGD